MCRAQRGRDSDVTVSLRLRGGGRATGIRTLRAAPHSGTPGPPAGAAPQSSVSALLTQAGTSGPCRSSAAAGRWTLSLDAGAARRRAGVTGREPPSCLWPSPAAADCRHCRDGWAGAPDVTRDSEPRACGASEAGCEPDIGGHGGCAARHRGADSAYQVSACCFLARHRRPCHSVVRRTRSRRSDDKSDVTVRKHGAPDCRARPGNTVA